MSRPFSWTVKIDVSETWIADGFEVKADALKDAILTHLLGYAHEGEVGVRVIAAPSEMRIAVAQGFAPGKAVRS